MGKIHNLYVECYLDTMLITALGFEPNGVHQSNSYVINSIVKCKIKAVGIIDKDKAKNLPSNLKKFIPVDEDKDNNLEFYVFENRFLVKVCRDVEHWLWHCNQQLDNPIEFPGKDVEGLKKISKKKIELEKNQKEINNFLNTLIQKNPPAIKKLRLYLHNHFKNQY